VSPLPFADPLSIGEAPHHFESHPNSIDSSPRHRHNAEYPQSEATIHYRFHPYAGMALPVTACKVHRDVVVLIVDLPDSTLAIPEWMARPEAAALGVRSPPLVPLQHLRELRITLDSLLSSLSDSISGGGDEATTYFRSTDFSSTEPTQFCVARGGTRRARTIGPENAAGDFVQRTRAHFKQGER
jgi:hypothetical protein